MNMSLFLSPILRFNKADWIYLQSLPVGFCCTVIRLRYHTVSLLGLRIYMCKYICIKRRRFHVTILLYGFREKWLGNYNPNFFKLFGYMFLEQNDLVVMLVIFIHFCFSFRMEVACYFHVLNLWYRGNNLSWENLYYMIWY